MEMLLNCAWAGAVHDVFDAYVDHISDDFSSLFIRDSVLLDEIYNADRLDDELYNDALNRLYLQHLRTRFAAEHNCKTFNRLAAQAA